jgi:SpoVK/Ycf46/Vps4 family AAA+-type ATPase
MTIVEIQEEFVSDERAVSFLKMLAKENHIRTDKNLFSKIKEGKGYLAPDLHMIFDEWYNQKLKTLVYPQYKDISVAKREVIKAAPKGNAYDELQEMIGLSEAKSVIQKALNYYKMQKLYEEKGFKRDSPAMHMVFTGNPGTAKTTAARLFARIMKDNGLLSKGQLIEVGRGDLVGKYVGWTAQTVQAKFKAAIGGVLFIDEAYSLVDEHNGSFGDEAINTIVQEMENHREDVVVIFAGYPDKMECFLQKNPGLRSRIAFHVPFADYSAEELCEIAALIGKGKGVTLDNGAMEKLKNIFESASKESDFGNGRYARNILEQAKMNQASRLLESDFDDITKDEISTIKAEDIVISEPQTQQKRKIGFVC